MCKWSSVADSVRAPDGTGLLACLEQLSMAGAYASTFLSLKLQCQIVRTLCRMLTYGGKEIVNALLDFDVIRCLLLFIQCVVDATLNATRQNQIPEFNKAHREILSAVSCVWRTIISIKSYKAVEDIVSIGVMQRLVELWLPCTASISISTSLKGNSDSDRAHNPLVVRSMACTMLRDLLSRGVAVGGEEVDDPLVSQLSIWLQATGTVKRELQTVQTVVGAGGRGGKNIACNMRKTAVDIIVSIAAASISALDDEMKVSIAIFPLAMHLLIYDFLADIPSPLSYALSSCPLFSSLLLCSLFSGPGSAHCAAVPVKRIRAPTPWGTHRLAAVGSGHSQVPLHGWIICIVRRGTR